METFRQADLVRPRKWTSLRVLIPLVIVPTLLLNVCLRFVSPSRVAFRAWDAAVLYASAEGHFAPNFRYASDRAFGDLATLGNLPSFRRYRREVFTTDDFGFRNSPASRTDKPPDILVVGDSFAVGCGVSDQDTLSVQLAELTGKAVYNGATDHGEWPTTQALIKSLGMRHGWIVWEFMERFGVARSVHDDGVAPQTNDKFDFPRRLRHQANDFLAYSPLSIFFDRALQTVQNDYWLPNPSRSEVFVDYLKNGDPLLFLPIEVKGFFNPYLERTSYFSEVNALVHETGNELLVVLVPDKYNVYYPLLRNAPPAPKGPPRLSHIEDGLIRSSVRVLNLTSALRTQAAEGMPDRRYNWFVDDTHWNRLGIYAAAKEISKYLISRAEANLD